MTFRLIPIGGLGNRLRAILSARALYGEVHVLWANSTAVHGASLTDVFEPISGLTFEYRGSGPAHALTDACHSMTSSPVDGAPADWCRGYMDLRPLTALQDKINTLRNPSDYIAIHARRTDHIDLAARRGHVTTNDEQWARAEHSMSTHQRLYVATDDPDTWTFFRNKHGELTYCNTIPQRVHGYENRPGTLADAVIDMFVCAAAMNFQGTWYSAFSETISIIRQSGILLEGFQPERDMPSMLEYPKLPEPVLR